MAGVRRRGDGWGLEVTRVRPLFTLLVLANVAVELASESATEVMACAKALSVSSNRASESLPDDHDTVFPESKTIAVRPLKVEGGKRSEKIGPIFPFNIST